MPRYAGWDFSESLVNILQIILARAMHPIPESKKAELSGLLESEKAHAEVYGNKVVEVLKLKRELEELLNDVQKRRLHIEGLEGECIMESRRLYDVQRDILESIGIKRFEPSTSIGWTRR